MRVLEREQLKPNLTPGGPVPLVVDIDGTLIQTDLLWEGVMQMLVRRPARVFGLFPALLRGRAALKAFAASHGAPDLDVMPMSPAVMELIEAARAAGRPVILASAAHQAQVDVLARQVGAQDGWGSDESVNLSAGAKLAKIQSACAGFDYVGNASADLEMWEKARNAYVVNANPLTLWKARRRRPDLIELPSSMRPLAASLRAIRPHQWAKNALLLLPALAAHVPFSWSVLTTLLAGFVAFSLAASAIYVINDLVDLPHDRRHPSKRRRPFAAGQLPIPVGILMVAGLVTTSLLLTVSLPSGFRWTLLGYLALTTAYSFSIKRVPVLDVIALATLYTARVIAGAALVDVPLSRWFLAFSVFLFLSLALVKRVVELQAKGATDGAAIPGRGYVHADIPMLTALGTSATLATALVYCLYITGTEVGRLYTNPDILWLELPLLLYWQIRVWLLTGRRQMVHDDPVVFALRDRASHVTLAVFLLVMVLAA